MLIAPARAGRQKNNHNPQATESDSFPNSAAWVKILSIKLMNRISDRGQLWQSQIFTWNESELFQECSPQGASGHSIVSLSRSALIGQTPMGLRCSKSRMYKRYAKHWCVNSSTAAVDLAVTVSLAGSLLYGLLWCDIKDQLVWHKNKKMKQYKSPPSWG